MDEVITCTLLGVASTTLFDIQANPSGREVWTGVRVRTPNGKTRFFPGMTVEAEASIILATAMERGETVELWLSGKPQRAHPYGIRTGTEEWYSDAFSADTRADAWRWVLRGILTLPIFGLGLFFLWEAAVKLVSSTTFAPHHSRDVFERGYEVGVLGQKVDVGTVERRKAA